MATKIKFSLEITKGLDKGKVFPFGQGEINIGRITGNDLILNDQTVSRQHAKIIFRNNKFILQDLGSQNGTRHNDIQIQEVMLQDGDEIAIGASVFRFRCELAPAEPTSDKTVIVGEQKLSAAKSRVEAKVEEQPPQEKKPANQTAANLLKLVKKPQIGIPLGLIVFLLILSPLLRKGKKGEQTDIDHSAESIPLPAAGVYGNTKGDRSHPDKAVFTFDYQGGKVFLDYAAGGIGQDEVSILLNGQKITGVPTTRKWFKVIKYELPAEFMKSRVPNQLVFENNLNPPGKESWGVKDVKVTQEPYPDCSPEKAQECFNRAEVRYEEKRVSYGNTYDAYVNYRQTMDCLEKCDPKPPIYTQAKEKMQATGKELDEEYQKHMLAAKQAYKLNDFNLVKSELTAVLQLVPNPDDYRYMQARKLLAKYNLEK
ncbi:MAG: FHA domain-containing protein [Candidatus Schekmanbacteria bacterium]|nr:FHA domain-containing protein [Candidatus Schekmanbacteria bacterium]